MMSAISTALNRVIPKNILFRNPYLGALVITFVSFLFLITYEPLNTHPSLSFSYEATMAIYCFGGGISAFLAISLLHFFNFFSGKKTWILKKELIAIAMVLFGFATGIYLIGFIMETPANRLNMTVYLDSLLKSSLVAGVPIVLTTVMNLKFVFYPEKEESQEFHISERPSIKVDKITIEGNQKKDQFDVNPDDIVYIESNGNYIDIYWNNEGILKKKTLRCALKKINEQLNQYTFFLQVHRAFIVNLRMVENKKGNSLGYQLKVFHSSNEVPVSRQNVPVFDEQMIEVAQD
ncbi:LytTR family transcriptional regulator [Puteibacter caeruleilacunae]|nr:LytTR family transcriptional regulator [Puteibacter caeruleilacunae]